MTPQNLRELRRLQIIEVARTIVAERGLEALTVGAIESRVSFSRGVISYHFKNKDEIVSSVFDAAINEIGAATVQAVAAATTPDARLESLVRANVEGFLGHVEASRILLSFWGRIAGDDAIAKVNADLYRGYRSSTARLIAEIQQSGTYRADVGAEAVAGLIVAIIIGLVTQTLFDPDGFDVESATSEAVASVFARLGRAQSLQS